MRSQLKTDGTSTSACRRRTWKPVVLWCVAAGMAAVIALATVLTVRRAGWGVHADPATYSPVDSGPSSEADAASTVAPAIAARYGLTGRPPSGLVW